MLEIEQKFANVDHAALKQKLSEWGISNWVERQEADHYLNAPDRDFAQTREAFRIRRCGEQNYLTYKGKLIDPNVKIRPELELSFLPGEAAFVQMLQLFQHLGYRPVTVVHKHRQVASLERGGFTLHVCLDEVEELGQFAELEIVAAEDQLESARGVLADIIEELELKDVEPRAYLTMLLAIREAATE